MRRWVWLVFVPILLAMAAFVVAVVSGFMRAFSFGGYTPHETEAAVAPLILWPAFGFAAFAYAASRLFKPGIIAREISSVCMAIFFGGFAGLAEAWNVWWTLALWAAIFLPWVICIEAAKPQKKPGRRRWRLAAFCLTCLATWGLIHYACFS